jgi:hypothetical protein
MRVEWEGARYDCTGLRMEAERYGADRAKEIARQARKRYEERKRKGLIDPNGQGRKPSDLRREVEAAGIPFERYRTRIRLGWSHEEALSRPARGHSSMPEHDSEQRKGATS